MEDAFLLGKCVICQVSRSSRPTSWHVTRESFTTSTHFAPVGLWYSGMNEMRQVMAQFYIHEDIMATEEGANSQYLIYMPSKMQNLNKNKIHREEKTLSNVDNWWKQNPYTIKVSPPLTGSNVRAAQRLTRFFSASKWCLLSNISPWWVNDRYFLYLWHHHVWVEIVPLSGP